MTTKEMPADEQAIAQQPKGSTNHHTLASSLFKVNFIVLCNAQHNRSLWDFFGSCFCCVLLAQYMLSLVSLQKKTQKVISKGTALTYLHSEAGASSQLQKKLRCIPTFLHSYLKGRQTQARCQTDQGSSGLSMCYVILQKV